MKFNFYRKSYWKVFMIFYRYQLGQHFSNWVLQPSPKCTAWIFRNTQARTFILKWRISLVCQTYIIFNVLSYNDVWESPHQRHCGKLIIPTIFLPQNKMFLISVRKLHATNGESILKGFEKSLESISMKNVISTKTYPTGIVVPFVLL